MKVLFLGDILGRAGRKAVTDHLPGLKASLKIDAVVANGENAASGFGLTAKTAQELFDAGVDVITGGNHTFDQKEIMPLLDSDPRFLRPLNYPDGTPGRGAYVYEVSRGRKLLVINVMARTFMNPLECPFRAADGVLKKYARGFTAHFILVDVHGEATSEKMAMGHFCDGRASLVVGTHSHVPTADAQIFDGGTAYQTDAGMCGDYNSVIGMEKEEPVQRFLSRVPKARYTPALGDGTMCGVYVETDDRTGAATKVCPVRVGGRLIPSLPQ